MTNSIRKRCQAGRRSRAGALEAEPARAEEADVGADRTIDDQVAKELLRSDEENLLQPDE